MAGQLEFSYHEQEGGNLKVAVNPRHYGKTLRVIEELVAALRTRIPFEYEVADEPSVQVLGGRRSRGMLSVEMTIKPAIDVSDPPAQLREVGFTEGIEHVLG